MPKLDLKAGNALIVVAHPDDETIWMGGVILKNPQINWTIFSLCRASDPDRAPKFKKVCNIYGADAIISDLEDDGLMNIKESILEIKKLLMEKIGQKSFTYIFTHGYNGEYGHPRHIGVHRTLKKLAANKELPADKIFNFTYTTDSRNKIVNNMNKAHFFIRLAPKELKTKRDIICNIYGFHKNSFENVSALEVETFL